MIEDKDKIKDLFSSKLQGFEPEVPASVWGGLDQLLSQNPAQATDPSSSSSSSSTSSASASNASVIKTVLIAVGVVATVATGVLLLNKKDKVVPEVKKEVIIEEPEVVDTLKTDTVFELKTITPVSSKRPATVKEEEPIISGPKDLPVVPPKEKEPEQLPAQEEPPLEILEPEVESKLIPKTKGVSIGVFANYGLLWQEINQRGGLFLFSNEVRGDVIKLSLKEENSEFTLKHKQPISFGVSIGKQLSSNLSFETGLVYTRLSSEITSSSIFNIRESQTFDYLGVPLSLNYTFYKFGKAELYLSAGGMIQKDIRGNYISNFDLIKPEAGTVIPIDHIYYAEPYYIKENIKQSNLQFSAHARLGIAYPLYKKLYLYGTFGGVYYFDANNKYRTIFSDRKTQLDLNLGIKFKF